MCLESRLEVKWQIYSRGSLILEKRCVKGRARCWCALVNFVLPTPQPTGPQRTLVHHHEKKTGFLNEKGHHAKSSLEENLHDDVKEQKIKFWVQLFRVSHELELPEYQSNKKKKKCVHTQTTARCLKITEKVSFNIASEASYVYILSGHKLIENAKNGLFLASFLNLKLEVKQCYQTCHFYRSKIGGNA